MMSAEQIEQDMTDAGKTGPRVAKGGVFAPADIELIKDALRSHLLVSGDKLSTSQERQIVNLLHRLNSRI